MAHNDIDLIFHALGDRTRRAMLAEMSAGPRSVSALAAPLNITLAAVVQHLQVLEACGLVHSEKVGRVRTCRVNADGMSVASQWLADRCLQKAPAAVAQII